MAINQTPCLIGLICHFTNTNQAVRRAPPSWLLQRVSEGRPLPRVDVTVPEETDDDINLGLESEGSNDTAATEQEIDDGASVAEQRCSKRSRSIPEEADLEKAADDPGHQQQTMPPPPPPSSPSQPNHLVKARATSLHLAVERLPTELFRELLEGSLGQALVSGMAL